MSEKLVSREGIASLLEQLADRMENEERMYPGLPKQSANVRQTAQNVREADGFVELPRQYYAPRDDFYDQEPDYDDGIGPEIDDENGMSEYRHGDGIDPAEYDPVVDMFPDG